MEKIQFLRVTTMRFRSLVSVPVSFFFSCSLELSRVLSFLRAAGTGGIRCGGVTPLPGFEYSRLCICVWIIFFRSQWCVFTVVRGGGNRIKVPSPHISEPINVCFEYLLCNSWQQTVVCIEKNPKFVLTFVEICYIKKLIDIRNNHLINKKIKNNSSALWLKMWIGDDISWSQNVFMPTMNERFTIDRRNNFNINST